MGMRVYSLLVVMQDLYHQPFVRFLRLAVAIQAIHLISEYEPKKLYLTANLSYDFCPPM